MSTSRSLTQGGKRHVQDVVQIQHHDGPIMLPDSMQDQYGNTDYDPAIKTLIAAKEHAQQTVVFKATLDIFPWEAALALKAVLERKLGAATLVTKTFQTFFGPVTVHPQAKEIKISPDETIIVPWGAPFAVPGLEGVELTLDSAPVEGRLGTLMEAEVKRKDEAVLKELAEDIRQYVRQHSIYKGKALTMRFEQIAQKNGPALDMPVIDFLDVRNADDSKLCYQRNVEDMIEDLIVTYIRNPELCRAAGLRPKRGALFAGPYGTGKTAQGRRIIKIATHDGLWTAIYLRDVKDLPKALPYVERFGRTVLFAEDLDKVAAQESDYAEVQKLSTALDGVENYKSEVFVICTTNNLDHVHKMLRRDGRFDVTVPIDLPDSEAAQRLLRAYGGMLIEEAADLTAAGEVLAGYPPATAEEVIQMAKLSYIRRNKNLNFLLNGEDVARAAHSMIRQKAYSQKVDERPRSKDEIFGFELGTGMAAGVAAALAMAPDEAAAVKGWSNDRRRSFLNGQTHTVRSLPSGS
jgi:hypothetical protein